MLNQKGSLSTCQKFNFRNLYGENFIVKISDSAPPSRHGNIKVVIILPYAFAYGRYLLDGITKCSALTETSIIEPNVICPYSLDNYILVRKIAFVEFIYMNMYTYARNSFVNILNDNNCTTLLGPQLGQYLKYFTSNPNYHIPEGPNQEAYIC
ncbi:hypothetical protein H8356DRAFT_1419229 [Neocallimastix lanati (nom. inval.)]|nr:hypothetical protein H8356DRAFT_1419229 [Neocallimastix sp. JGI-2020a]